MSGANIVGVQFRRAGKIYDFFAKKLLLAKGDHVVVDTERGPSVAEVVAIRFADDAKLNGDELKSVIRVANSKDMSSYSKEAEDEKVSYIKSKIKDLNLDMSFIGLDSQLGGSKIIVYFTAPGRVDFRELVKELANGLKSRVELKQVGARDEAKLLGGLGICGREFCCSSFLREFVPVSIKMAKNQNLALNPSKVSGGCGRLLCCLTYEDHTYVALKKKLPGRKAMIQGPDGNRGRMIKSDILNQWIVIETETGEQIKYAVKDIKVLNENEASSQEESEGDDGWGDDLDLSNLMDSVTGQSNDKKPNKSPSSSRSNDARSKNYQSKDQQSKDRQRFSQNNAKSGAAVSGQAKSPNPRNSQQASGNASESQSTGSTANPGSEMPKKRRRNRRRKPKGARSNPQNPSGSSNGQNGGQS